MIQNMFKALIAPRKACIVPLNENVSIINWLYTKPNKTYNIFFNLHLLVSLI